MSLRQRAPIVAARSPGPSSRHETWTRDHRQRAPVVTAVPGIQEALTAAGIPGRAANAPVVVAVPRPVVPVTAPISITAVALRLPISITAVALRLRGRCAATEQRRGHQRSRHDPRSHDRPHDASSLLPGTRPPQSTAGAGR